MESQAALSTSFSNIERMEALGSPSLARNCRFVLAGDDNLCKMATCDSPAFTGVEAEEQTRGGAVAGRPSRRASSEGMDQAVYIQLNRKS